MTAGFMKLKGNSQDTQSDCSKVSMHKQTPHDFGGRISNTKKADLTNALATWIASDCRPISIVEDPGLLKVLQLATNNNEYRLPSRSTIQASTDNLHLGNKADLQSKLDTASFVALKRD